MKTKRTFGFLQAVVVLLTCGCNELPPKVASSIESMSTGVSKADDGAQAFYAFALSLCDDEACQAKLKEFAEPMIDGFQIIRTAWCMIKPEAESCNQKETP